MRRQLAVLAAAFVITLPLITPRIYASDEVQYFAYLRSLWFDQDVSFENEYQHFWDANIARSQGFHETYLERQTETGFDRVQGSTPAVVSVVEKINEPRYPSFKGIMAAKKKPVTTVTVADLGLDAGAMGLESATSEVVDVTLRPPRQAGQVVKDEGDGGVKLAEFLASQKLI